MKALSVALILAASSLTASATIVKKELTQEEIQFAISLSDMYKADFKVSGPCSGSSFKLTSENNGMLGIDSYMFETEKQVSYLNAKEAQQLISLVDRLGVES
ncbi:MAG: hypothetical protein K2Q18_03435, partial [Bdellovibrionales bacterium]|nr:hypothetical protein [Bdellovibrionales bacterium]